jgi:ABC-2 type transport system permease protein
MDFKRSKRLMAIWAACYWILAVTIYLVAGQQFHYTAVTSDALSATTTVGELVDGMTITQRLIAPAESLTGFDLMAATYGRSNTGTLHAVFTNNAGEVVAAKDIDIATLPESKYFTISLDSVAQVQAGDPLTLTLTTTGCMPGNAITIYCGDTIVAGRFDIVQSISEADRYTINGVPGAGKLCVKVNCIRTLTFYRDYWLIIGGAFAALALLCLYWWRGAKDGRNNPLVAVCMLFTRYGFLIRQLVSRDFKTKYKRSALGMAWSFLNPLLTMSVQYVVFSTLFQSDIPNYPVYLLSGIVFFNFFSEAVSMGMTSITGNASLIKKVYMPKYIYPVSRILSSLVNFALAIIPLLLVMLITGTAFTPALLLLIFDMLCLLGFVTGMSLLLTTAMTFFQDTQFLWGVVSMMWMYLTPLFYPESIIPAQFLTVYHMNPMYQYITFARICIIDGVSPEPMAYLWCILSSVVVLGLGILTFKRHQDKFVLYL